MMRLDKMIAECTEHSRSDVAKLVRRKLVTVNGAVAKLPDVKVSENDDVRINGTLMVYRKFVYLMLNKPQGYLSATEDKTDPVVTDLLPVEFRPFLPFPIGRLDKDTEGLLLLSNDGQFAHALTSPKKNVWKRYFAILDRPAEAPDIDAFKAGMTFKEFAAKAAVLEITDNPCEVYIEIAEGKFHQVKRMCEQVGKNVLYLQRVAIGGLSLDEALPLGAMRELAADEIALLLGKNHE